MLKPTYQLEYKEGMTNEEFTAYIKESHTLEERIAYVKETKERLKKEEIKRKENRFKELSIDNWTLSDKWVKFKKETGINCFAGEWDHDHYHDKVFVYISTMADLPPYCLNPEKTFIGSYKLSITDEELINESVKFLEAYDKHQNEDFGIFYVCKKSIKQKPKTTLF